MTEVDRERLFLGIDLTPEARSAVQVALEEVPRSALPDRLVPMANWHITLRFLGATTGDQRDLLMSLLKTAPLSPSHDLGLGGWGAFPRASAARVFWLGVEEESGALVRLAARAEALARETGFPPEGRPFKPHLTLGRLRDPTNLHPLLQLLPPLHLHMTVREITLFRSRLGPGAPSYEVIDRIPLQEATG